MQCFRRCGLAERVRRIGGGRLRSSFLGVLRRLCAPGQEKGRGELREQFLAAHGVRCTGLRAGAECSALSVRSGRASAEDRRWEAEEQLSGRLSRLCAPGQEKRRGELGEQFLAALGVRCTGLRAGAECSVFVGAVWQSECGGSAVGG